jgi:hypothetical protein
MVKNRASLKFILSNLIPASIFLYILRPIRDDWSNFSNLRGIPFNVNGLINVATNQWCCTHEKRFFFFSWLIQWPMAHLGDLSFVAVYLLCAAILLRLNWNVFQILITSKINLNIALLISGTIGWSAGSVIIGGWANNIFFTLPLALFSELIRNLWFTEKSKPFNLAILIFACEFSGESTLGLLGIVLLIYFFQKYRAKENLFVPLFFLGQYVISALLNYGLTSGPRALNHQLDFTIFRNYFEGLKNQHLRLWNINSSAYGIESRNFKLFTIFCVLMILNVAIQVRFKNKLKENSLIKELPIARLYLFSILAWLAIFVPMILGVVSGSRTGPDYRYQLPLFIGIIATISLIYLRIDYPRKLSIFALSLFVAITFAASLEVRARMHSLDEKIWEKIESNQNFQNLEGIVTYNPHTNYPMPPYHSFAESDFQADWGIGGKYFWLTNRRIPVYSNLMCNSEFSCTARDYSGNEFEIKEFNGKHFIYIYTDTKIDELDLTFDKINVSTNYQEFLDFVMMHPKIQG